MDYCFGILVNFACLLTPRENLVVYHLVDCCCNLSSVLLLLTPREKFVVQALQSTNTKTESPLQPLLYHKTQ